MTTKEFYENNKGLYAKYEKAEMVRIVGYTIHSVIVVLILGFDIKDLQFCSKDFYVDKDFVNNNEKIRLVDLIDLSTIKDFDGTEAEHKEIPAWVVDCLLNGVVPPASQKLGFFLESYDEKELPHVKFQ